MTKAFSVLTRKILVVMLLMALAMPLNVTVHNASAAAGTSDEFDQLREKWKAYLVGGDFSPEDPDVAGKIETISQTAKDYWDTLVKTSPGNYIWPDLDDSTIADPKSQSSPMTLAYQRLEAMSLAYSTKGAHIKDGSGQTVTLYQNADLLNDIKNALNWLYAKKYNENRTIGKTNWFDWCIGTPLTLNNTTILLYDQLSPDEINNYMKAINKFTPDPTKANGGKATGANLMYVATVVGVRGITVKDGAKIAASRDAISPIFEYVTSSDGFYEDGSFLQHGAHPYTGGYGKALLANLVSFVYLLDGSTWKVTDPKLQNMYRWVYDSYEPVVYKGGLMDMIRGREISRFNQQDHLMGHDVMNSVVHLASFAPPEHAARLKSLVKEWIQSETFLKFYDTAPIFHLLIAKGIMNDPNVTARGELVTNRQFPNMDRTVHLRPDFGFGISMSSSRIFNYESINSENLKGWYAGDGMTYLYNGDLSQYTDYWGTVNKYRLPGTTVDTQTRADSSGQSYKSPKNWVGGTNIAGQLGVSGMELKAWNSTLTAKKSWFMFDDEIVALGSGISSTDNRAIESIVENRKIKDDGSNTLTVNGAEKPAQTGWSETLNNVSTIHLQGNVPGSDIGYYFPQPATVNAVREARTDKWSNDNLYPKFTDPTDITKNYVTLWEDHGSNPANAGYDYVLLPNKTSAQTTEYAKNPDIEILENSADAQAVREKKLNVTAANFWNDGTKTLQADGKDFLASDKKASVMTAESADTIEVAVSDPTQVNTGTINLELNRAASGAVSADSGVTVTQLGPTIRLTVNVSNAKGKTFRVKLALEHPPVVTAAADAAPNANGWYNADVKVTFTATDNDMTPVATVDAPVVVSTEGANQLIEGSATDTAGNKGTASLTVSLDKTAPTAAVTANGQPLAEGAAFPSSDAVTLALQAADSLSGVDSQTLSVDGAAYVAGTALDFAGKPGPHSVIYSVTDKAGNTLSGEIKFSVVTSFDSIRSLIERFAQSGDIDDPTAKLLLNIVDQAKDQLDKKHIDQAKKKWDDFIKQLEHRDDTERVSEKAKQVLTAEVNGLLQQLSQ